MATHAISYGTKVWLADLLESGWAAKVVEHRPVVHHYHLRLVDDLEEAVRESVTPARVGVLCEKNGSGIFIPCADADEARALLERATEEVLS